MHSGGTVKEAAIAAPMDDPGSEGEVLMCPRLSNVPFYKNKLLETNQIKPD